MMQRFTAALSIVAVALLLSWSYGPGLPLDRHELHSAFAGRRVVVCGASYGIGADIAFEFAKANARLVIGARSREKLEAVAKRCEELGARDVHVISADFSTMDGSKTFIASAKSVLGGVDVLVLNHIIGIYEDWPARVIRGHEDGSLDNVLSHVEQMVSVNVLSYIYLSSYALPSLAASGGRIIAVGSLAGKVGLQRIAPYSATKHAVFGYFNSLRQDLILSPDPGLRNVSITTGILGSFDTDNARQSTQGILDNMDWRPPSEAAIALLTAGARGWNEVYTPWEQTRIISLLHPLMPSTIEWVIRKIVPH